MKRLIIIIFLFPLIVVGQKNYSVLVEPEPYMLTPYFDDMSETGLRTIAVVSKSRQKGFVEDTLNISYYNTKGQKIRVERYKSNKPKSKTLLKYSDDNKLLEWQMYDYGREYNITKSSFYYNADKQETISVYSTESKGKVRGKQIKRSEYDRDKLMLKKFFTNEVQSNVDSFIYDNDMLIEYINSTSMGFAFKTFYAYDSLNQLISRKTYQQLNNDLELYDEKLFFYSDGNLIEDRELTQANLLDSNYVITKYNYYDDRQLQDMNVTYKDNFRDVHFEYKKGKKSRVLIKTDILNSAYLKYWIVSSVNSYYDLPIDYEETFIYDSKGNITNKKISINGELESNVDYVIEYF